MTNTTNNEKSNTVILPDGDVGTAGPTICGEVRVYHHDRVLGCGPWIFPASQVVAAPANVDAAYQARCEAAAPRRRHTESAHRFAAAL